MKLGAIDIGTNSMRLLIAEYVEGKFFDRQKYINTTRIGQGVDENGYISKDAIDRNIDALKEFVNIAKEEKCERIWAIGTSALRDSKNKDEFLDRAYKEANIKVEVITGEEEANLGFIGTIKGINEDKDILVLDIGGGSTEFIFGDSKEGIKFLKSEDVGALRMTEKFLKIDPIDKRELHNLNNYIDKTINNTIKHINEMNISRLIGIGGTITSLSAINIELETYDMNKIHNSKLTISDIQRILNKLTKLTIDEKKKLKGLQPKRADIITAGTCILMSIMEGLNIQEITISEYDNLEGLICQKSRKMS
ncbi:Ppx/GppA phosphatase family protein [Alkalithermobacter paradoxus]|uniref:Exopolyphosphatase n=1 Tax=Alkalithermobacter paradoxus TaxID=29349 RepID=A0A1V4I542_9FIRM|nr:exopolyphosphatase [[Clostridium] thermoalcaliphilum]